MIINIFERLLQIFVKILWIRMFYHLHLNKMSVYCCFSYSTWFVLRSMLTSCVWPRADLMSWPCADPVCWPHPSCFRDQYPGSRGSYNTPSESGAPYRGGQPTYGDYDDRYPGPPLPSDPYREIPLDDSQHQALPHGDPYNGGHPDEINRSYGDPQYRDQPYDDDGYRGPPRYDEHDASRDADPHYGGHPDDSFRGPTEVPGYRNSYQDPPYDSYGSRPGEDYGHLPETGNEPQYGGSYQGHPDDPNTDPNDPRFRENYQNNPEDPYGDRHENPYGGSIGPQGDVDDPRYRNSYQGHPDDPYADRPGDDPDLIRRMQGLPPLRKDPFADDPFQETRNGSYPGLRPGEEDPYNRGPSPSQGESLQ